MHPMDFYGSTKQRCAVCADLPQFYTLCKQQREKKIKTKQNKNGFDKITHNWGSANRPFVGGFGASRLPYTMRLKVSLRALSWMIGWLLVQALGWIWEQPPSMVLVRK